MASATGAAVSAPKKVPAERIETIVADWDAVTLRWPVLSTKPVENWSSQKDMARMPLIVPVSYLFVYIRRGAKLYSYGEGIYGFYIPKQNTAEGNEHANRNGWP